MNSQRHNGQLYYKDPSPYYGPQVTYRNVPTVEDVKFITPVTVEQIEIFHNEESLKQELNEAEKELSNLLLFSSEPKNLHSSSVNNKYALPYYDPTKLHKENQMMDLKHRIVDLRKTLHLNEDINLYVVVNNSTFPKTSDELVKNYRKSYSNVHKYENGNFSNIDDIYDFRKHVLENHQNEMNLKTTPLKNNIPPQQITLNSFNSHTQQLNNNYALNQNIHNDNNSNYKPKSIVLSNFNTPNKIITPTPATPAISSIHTSHVNHGYPPPTQPAPKSDISDTDEDDINSLL